MSKIDGTTRLCMIIGDPVAHTLSPLIHNAGYEAAGLAGKYVFVAAQVAPQALPAALAGLRALNIRGASCTLPHKEAVLPLLDEVEETAREIGAVNTIVNDRGKLRGYNTDWLGVARPLEEHMRIQGKRAAVIGAGGAARAACFALTRKGARVKIFNRTAARARELAAQFGCEAGDLNELGEVIGCDIVINASSVGMQPAAGETPIAADCLHAGQVVFDFVYRPHRTRLLDEAAQRGAAIIHGSEMLLHQACAQFELYTGKEPPTQAMRAALREEVEQR